ncbi:MAG: hypothetical protein AAGC57_03155 [Pseudomonadota bacterium]
MKKMVKNFKLDDMWFKKESLPEVYGEADKFVRALKVFSSADNGLNLEAGDEQLSSSDLASLNKAKAMLGDVEKAGRELQVKCPSLAKSAGDKKVSQGFTTTGEVLKKVLPKAIQDKREEYDGYDGDGDDAPLVSPDAHKAYLKRYLPRLKRMPHNFGFALVSNEPNDQRFLFHKQKAARSLATMIKSDSNAKQTSFGIAAAGSLISEERFGANTLVLNVEGKVVPSLARRARLLFQSLGISTFNNIVVLRGDEQIELSDESEGDVPLATVTEILEDDVEEAPEPVDPPAPEAPAQDAPMGQAPPEKPKPQPRQANPEERRWLELRGTLAPRVERAIEMKHGVFKKTKAVWGMARQAADTGDFGGAIKAASMLQALLKGFEPPPEDPAAKYERQKKKIFPLMAEYIKAGKPGAKGLRLLYGEAEARAAKGQMEAALELLDLLARDIAAGGPKTEPVPKGAEAQAALARTLIEKTALMESAAHRLAEAFDGPERVTYSEDVAGAGEAARHALGDPGDPAASRSFSEAFAALSVLDRLVQRGQARAKKGSDTLGDLRQRIDEIDGRVKPLAPLVHTPELKPLFAAAAMAREQMTAAMRRKDVFGAMARIGPWDDAVSRLVAAAEAVSPETV